MKSSQKYRHSRVHSSHYDLDGLAESTTPPNFEKRQRFIKKIKKETNSLYLLYPILVLSYLAYYPFIPYLRQTLNPVYSQATMLKT